MAAFAHRLKTLKELECAAAVNRYLVQRSGEIEMIPHRERALEIFGDEKALDHCIHAGLFKGRILLSDLDCFYCPEPLPFHRFSLDIGHTRGKPLLVVENANTYWSCCRANEKKQQFSAVVYGQGFNVCAAQRASDGLMEIKTQVGAQGLHYFGDLDPTGLAIARRIDGYRREKGLSPLLPEIRLYRALLRQNRATPYDGSQVRDHDPEWTRQWLGEEIAETYLKHADRLRWPQEGLTARGIADAL
jgi:hypothetical protein